MQRPLTIFRPPSACATGGHLARTGLEVIELLEPAYDPVHLKTAVVDAGGQVPARRGGRPRRRRAAA